MNFDPIALEILSNKVGAAAEEMSFTLQRTGRTLYVKETADFATGLVDLNGRFFAYPRDIGVSNYMDLDCRPIIEAVEDLAPGDVVITNHPYLSEGLATHLPDLHMIQPYFHEGRIVAFGWCFIHCTDVGGRVASSISPSNDEIFQEGLMIPPVRIMIGGKPNREFMSIFRSNSRTPDDNAGDVKAMVAALATGEQRVADLIAQHGVDEFVAAQEILQQYSAEKARAVLRQIPDGEYDFWDYLDDDFTSTVPARLRVRMRVEDGLVHLDYTGTDPQVASAYNVPTGNKRHPWLTLRLIAFILTYDRTIPINSGLYRPMSLNAPQQSIINPGFPAAVGVRHATATRVNDLLNGALVKAVPHLMKAPSGGVTVPVVFTEPDGTSGGRKVLVVEPMVGGSGAMLESDGVDGRDSGIANLGNNPVESVETSCSLRILEYGLRPDSGGAGRWRGGAGVLLRFEVLVDGAGVLGRGMERFRFAPWGIEGGRCGALFEVFVERKGGAPENVGKIDLLSVDAGDVVTIRTPGGGGYGHPFERDPQAVLSDVVRGLVTVQAARDDYGIAVRDGVLDAEETARLRNGGAGKVEAFDFGAEREAFDTVFDDGAIAALNEKLLAMPHLLRIQKRREIFAAVMPAQDGRPGLSLATEIADKQAARARFTQLVQAL